MMRIGKRIPSCGANKEDHGDGGEAMVIKCSGLEKKKNKQKAQGKGDIHRSFLVW